MPLPFQWGTPVFGAAAVVGMLAGYVASMVESVGDYYACARLSGAPVPTAKVVNRGIGTEATRLVVDHVFGAIDDPPVNRLELEVYAFNPRAITVYERIGFVREGVRRAALRWDGEFVDAITMSILRSEWAAR